MLSGSTTHAPTTPVLLLGLSGIMSEAELHQIKFASHQASARRPAPGRVCACPFALRVSAHGRMVRVCAIPNEEVQAPRLLFFCSPSFRNCVAPWAVMRYLHQAGFVPAGTAALCAGAALSLLATGG